MTSPVAEASFRADLVVNYMRRALSLQCSLLGTLSLVQLYHDFFFSIGVKEFWVQYLIPSAIRADNSSEAHLAKLILLGLRPHNTTHQVFGRILRKYSLTQSSSACEELLSLGEYSASQPIIHLRLAIFNHTPI